MTKKNDIKISIFKKADGLAGIWQTMYLMRELVYRSKHNRLIKNTSVSLIKNLSPLDYLRQVKAVFDFIKSKMKYVKDYFQVEEIQSPQRILKSIQEYGYAYGDCDDMAIISASMLYALGFRLKFVVIATKPRNYNHIRSEVFINGNWIPLELSSSLPFGQKFKSYEKPLELEL